MNSSFKPKPCADCGSVWHSRGYHKPRTALKQATTPMRRESDKTRSKRLKTARSWHKVNKPDSDGMFTCYLQIAPDCPKRLTKDMLVLEHYHSKARRPDLKFEVSNIKPSCDACNGLKLSKSGSEFNK